QPFTNYQVDWPFLFLRNSDSSQVILAFNFYNRIKINSITPAAAFKFGDFSLGISANIYQVKQEVTFPQANERWPNNVGLAAYQFEYMLDAWTFGGTVGFMYDVNSDLRIGAKIKSGFKADLKGDAKSTMFAELDSSSSLVNVNSSFEIPWSFGGGIVYSLSENLKLNIDAEYSLWGSNKKNLSYNFNNSVWQSGLTETDSVTGINASSFSLNYNNTIDAGFGLEYSSPEIVYRFGYRFNQSPNSNSTYSYLFPSVDQHIFSLGIGYKDERLTIDAAISYAWGVSKDVDSSANQNLFGSYSSSGYIPTITLKYGL
ncbi:MAG: outer membrane protein transport protein, partial [Ignavibacteriaceae bacterium]